MSSIATLILVQCHVYLLSDSFYPSFAGSGRYVTWSLKFSRNDTVCQLTRQLKDFNEPSTSMVLSVKLHDLYSHLPFLYSLPHKS